MFFSRFLLALALQVLILPSLFAQSDVWQFQLPYPTVHNLNKVTFADSLTGWAVGQGGTVLSTTDGGRIWERQVSIGDTILQDVFFLNKQIGWILGERGMFLRTTDGGRHWQRLGNVGGTRIWFTSAQVGYRASFSILYKTTNGGQSWSQLRDFGDVSIKRIQFTSPAVGFAVVDSFASNLHSIYRTANAGATWIRQIMGNSAFPAMDMVSNTTGYATGTNLMKTTDACRTFTDVSGIPEGVAMDFASPDTGLILDDLRAVTRTMNGGASSQRTFLTSDVSARFTDIAMAGNQRGWVVGNLGRIFASRNTGANWQEESRRLASSAFTLNAIQMVNRQVGYVGGGRCILKTKDGGRVWQRIPLATNRGYSGVYFISPDTGWVGDDGGLIKKTIDGGQNWTDQPTGQTYPLTGIYFTSPDTGFATSWGGLLATTDGGVTWAPRVVPGAGSLLSIRFVNARKGWVCGTSGRVFHTADGGVTWVRQPISTLRTLNSLCFLDENTGWVAGTKQALYRTVDGGVTWTLSIADSASQPDLYAIGFANARNGFAAGRNGARLRTVDSGRTWTPMLFDVTTNLNAIFFLDAGNGWMVGSENVIMKLGEIPILTATRPIASAPQTTAGFITPNPSQGIFSVDLEKAARVEVFTMDGRRVSTLPIQQAGKLDLNLTGQPKGLYLIHLIEKDGKREVRKAVVQ